MQIEVQFWPFSDINTKKSPFSDIIIKFGEVDAARRPTLRAATG